MGLGLHASAEQPALCGSNTHVVNLFSAFVSQLKPLCLRDMLDGHFMLDFLTSETNLFKLPQTPVTISSGLQMQLLLLT